MFLFLGLIANIPNGGISNVGPNARIGALRAYIQFSTLVIQGLGFNTLNTALLGIPQGVFVVIWIGSAALINGRLPKNSRLLVAAGYMLPTIAGALGFLLAPTDAYVGRLICL